MVHKSRRILSSFIIAGIGLLSVGLSPVQARTLESPVLTQIAAAKNADPSGDARARLNRIKNGKDVDRQPSSVLDLSRWISRPDLDVRFAKDRLDHVKKTKRENAKRKRSPLAAEGSVF